MSDPAWPASLPQRPLTNGVSEQPGDNVLRSSTDAGPGKQRRRYTAKVSAHTVSFMITTAQVATFETFWEESIFDGSLPFTLMHYRKETQVRMLPVGPYKIDSSDSPDYWVVNLNLKEIP